MGYCFYISCDIKLNRLEAIDRGFNVRRLFHQPVGEVLIRPTEDPEWASVGKGQRPFTPNLTNINTVYTVEIPGYVGLGRTMVPRGSELLGLYGTA